MICHPIPVQGDIEFGGVLMQKSPKTPFSIVRSRNVHSTSVCSFGKFGFEIFKTSPQIPDKVNRGAEFCLPSDDFSEADSVRSILP
jgi:hypothetical protein